MSLEAEPVEQSGSSSDPPAIRGEEGPSRGPLLVACVVLVAAPTVVLLGVCVYLAFWLIVVGNHDQTSPMNLLAAIVFPVPLLLVLLFEYHAVVRRSAVAALLLGALFLFPLFPGTIALANELGPLLSRAAPEADAWPRVFTVTTCVVVSTFISVVHLAWWRRLMRWQCEIVSDNAPE